MSVAIQGRAYGQRWSDEALQQLVDAYNAGASAGVLADRWGVQRNAVVSQINKAKRRGWHVRLGQPDVSRQRKTGSRQPMRAASRADKRKPDVTLAPIVPDSDVPSSSLETKAEALTSAPTPDLEAVPSGSGVLLEDAERHQCRFPLWPHKAKPGAPGYGVVCGADIFVAPSQATTAYAPLYCEHHRKVCSDGKPKRSTKASASRLKLPHLKPQVAR